MRRCSSAWRRTSLRKRAGDGRYPKVRWWGEMVNVLWEQGNVAASMSLEDQFDRLAKHHEIAIFCSFVMDNFNSEVHSRLLPRLGQNHSHLIPVEDYARLERAVGDALRQTVGADDARVLEQQLLSNYSPAFQDAALSGVAPGTARESSGCRGVRVDAQPRALSWFARVC